MTRVRGAHATRLFLPVQRQDICAQFLIPERQLKLLFERIRFSIELLRNINQSKLRGNLGCRFSGGVNIALHFA